MDSYSSVEYNNGGCHVCTTNARTYSRGVVNKELIVIVNHLVEVPQFWHYAVTEQGGLKTPCHYLKQQIKMHFIYYLLT